MRPSAVVRVVLATLALSAAPALAQGAPPALARTLTVPRVPGSAPAPAVHLRAQLATTLELDFPVREPRLTGPGADAVTVQQLEPHVLSLYPSHGLGPWQAPTLTLTAEDGTRYPFTLVMDGAVDVKVRVQRGECPPPGPLEESATRFLLRQPVERLRLVAFQRLGNFTTLEGVTLHVEGTLPLAPHALLILTLDDDTKPFVPGDVLLGGPAAAPRVLGMGALDGERAFSVIVERPEGQADGTEYTVTVTEKDGARRFAVTGVTPWPLAPPSPQGDVLRPQQRPEGVPGGARHRKVPGTQRLQPRE
jgi:hypothetical protein